MIFPLQQQWLQEVKITGKNARTESCTCMIKILKLDDEGKNAKKKPMMIECQKSGSPKQ